MRYDRNVVIADPGAAIQRAAMEAMGKSLQGVGQAMGKGLFGMGKSLLDVGAFTVEQLTSKQQEESKQKQSATSSNADNNPNANSSQPIVESAASEQKTMPLTSETTKESRLTVDS